MSPAQPDRPAFEVTVGGSALSAADAADVITIDVHEEIGKHGRCALLVQNWNPDSRTVRAQNSTSSRETTGTWEALRRFFLRGSLLANPGKSGCAGTAGDPLGGWGSGGRTARARGRVSSRLPFHPRVLRPHSEPRDGWSPCAIGIAMIRHRSMHLNPIPGIGFGIGFGIDGMKPLRPRFPKPPLYRVLPIPGTADTAYPGCPLIRCSERLPNLRGKAERCWHDDRPHLLLNRTTSGR